MSRPVVVAVGLGPGGADLVTSGTLDLIGAIPHRYLRTERHPAAPVVAGASTFDHVYEASSTIEEVYSTIVEELVAAAARHGRILYAVPGSPVVAEHTVELLLADDRVRTEVVAALSFLDLTWARLGVDPVEVGARLVDGHRFAVEAAGERGPLLVAQCDNRFVLSDIKLAVEEPPQVPVTVLQRLGTPEEAVFELEWSEMDRSFEPDHLTSLWIPALGDPVAGEVAGLDQLMRRLRVEDPWKAAQTHASLKRYLVEEAYEVLEAIDAYDPSSGEGADELCGELGDLLYQVVFHSAIAAEAGWFTLADVAAAIHDKLVRRHPHVFAPAAGDPPGIDELVAAWEADKRDELGRASVMDGIPSALPALARAAKALKKAQGLAVPDLPDAPAAGGEGPPVPDAAGPDAAEHQDVGIGQALFSLVRRAHDLGVDPEDALRRETDRRIEQIRRIERGSEGPGETP